MSPEKKQQIKDKIGSVILNHLKNLTIRIILKKEPEIREPKEIERVANYLKSIKDFEPYRLYLTDADFKQLASKVTFKEFKNDDLIYKIGESADSFNIMLEGSAVEEIKNQSIEQWEWAMSVYNALLQWKSSVFDELA